MPDWILAAVVNLAFTLALEAWGAHSAPLASPPPIYQHEECPQSEPSSCEMYARDVDFDAPDYDQAR